jgi:hypothetical protein
MPVAIQSEPVSEKTRRPRSPRDDGFPHRTVVTPRNDNELRVREQDTSFLSQLDIART